MIIHLAIRPEPVVVDRMEISETDRGERGFGGNENWNIPAQ